VGFYGLLSYWLLRLRVSAIRKEGGPFACPLPPLTHRERSRPEVINSFAPTAGTGFAFDLTPPRVTLYQIALIMTHRDGLTRFLARSARRSDAVYRKMGATTSKSLVRPPFRSRPQPVGVRRKALTMINIACSFSPARRAADAISMGHY